MGTLLVIGNDLAFGKELQQSPLAQIVTQILQMKPSWELFHALLSQVTIKLLQGMKNWP